MGVYMCARACLFVCVCVCVCVCYDKCIWVYAPRQLNFIRSKIHVYIRA